jgi:hypothetical protein
LVAEETAGSDDGHNNPHQVFFGHRRILSPAGKGMPRLGPPETTQLQYIADRLEKASLFL